MKTPRLLTPELENNILSAIRAGSYPEVAAAAFGVPKRLFRRWLRRGIGTSHESLACKVAQAQGTARVNAEIRVHEKDPRLWLRAGPGRETKDAIGWTTFVRPQARDGEAGNFFEAPAMLHLLSILREALEPYPEALQALARALELKGKQPL